MDAVTSYRMEFTGEYDEAKIAKYIQREAKGIFKCSQKFGTNLTMDQCIDGAKSMAEMYHHNFRIYKKVKM